MTRGSVFLTTPTGKDGLLIKSVLEQSGYDPILCANIEELKRTYHDDAGAVVVAVEALVGDSLNELRDLLRSQPPWSDIPVILLLYESASSAERIRNFFGKYSSINFLERPVSRFVLVNAVQIALRSRQRQFEVRDLLALQEAARQHAEQENSQKDYFLAMLAHELRNPLASIRNCLQILTPVDPSASKVMRAAEISKIQMSHITRLVDDLLDVARIRTGKFVLKRQIMDLSRITRVACESILPMVRERAQTFEQSIEENIMINGDPVRIQEALLNLLNNASKYTPEGGTIRVRLMIDGDRASVRIQDTGQGIEEDLQHAIFDPFFQASTSLERRNAGLGLGLYLVRVIVELHDGKVLLCSAGANQGSEFELRLPVTKVVEPCVSEPMLSSGLEEFSCHMLLIEDQALIAESMRMVLEASGCSVDWAANGEEGLRRLSEVKYDAALVDIGLPDMTGYDLAKRIVRTEHTPLLIALTGYGQEDDKNRALEAGFDAHFTKPVNEHELYAFIHSRLKSETSG